MTEITSTFTASEAEERWYSYWENKGYFKSTPDEREPFTILIPPPNVTGVLHMGHMLNNTIQDVLIRKARMEGKNALWVPGTDHASIATEAKVVAKLKTEGISKADISREEFMQHAWAWTEKHGGIIFQQLRRLGASCDWDREVFTLDEKRYESVIRVFVDLYEKDKIYRGYRMVNWDTEAKTTVSDEEVIHKDVQSKLYYLNYAVEGTDDTITIATTRPETILGDTAICINPNDERYSHLKGKRAIVPIANRSIPIIEDDYVDVEFGTGCLKITPAHDVNDKEIGDRHQLEIIDILNDDGTLNNKGLHYEGQDRFVARKNISHELKELGFLQKVEDYNTTVGTSERTGSVIEPKLSQQWFLSMKELSKPALKAVMEDTIELVPDKFKNTYRHWMENVRDWCISRQLYWGHRIPAWFYGSNEDDFVVALNAEDALGKAKEKSGNNALKAEDLRQEEDALDTWFSSWLWPLSVFDGINNPNNEEVNYYFPSNVLVTAPEILFFWVARMIIIGYEYKNEKPFDTVYLTGIVRDKLGRKMSKSLGNSPDAVGLIEQYGADGVRVGMLLTSPAGNDLPFDESLCQQGRNFSNKIWNAMRLVKGWEVKSDLAQPESAKIASEWFDANFNATLAEIEDLFKKYRLSEALMAAYKLTWDGFCSWYLEMVKPAYQKPIDAKTYQQVITHFEKVLKILHPFMPFVTEEIWHLLKDREEEDNLIIAPWPSLQLFDQSLITDFEGVSKVIAEIRTFRKKQGIANKEQLQLQMKAVQSGSLFDSVVIKLGNLSAFDFTEAPPESAYSFVSGNKEYFIPLEGTIDVAAEKEKIKAEIEYAEGFLKSVMKKLSNERFVCNAPDQVVEIEKKKKQDAEEKIQMLQAKLAAL